MFGVIGGSRTPKGVAGTRATGMPPTRASSFSVADGPMRVSHLGAYSKLKSECLARAYALESSGREYSVSHGFDLTLPHLLALFLPGDIAIRQSRRPARHTTEARNEPIQISVPVFRRRRTTYSRRAGMAHVDAGEHRRVCPLFRSGLAGPNCRGK